MRVQESKQNLIKLLSSIQEEDQMYKALEGLFTPAEFEEISKRLEIIGLLKSGVSQREISEKLGVGIGTVTRGSNELKRGNFASINWWFDLKRD